MRRINTGSGPCPFRFDVRQACRGAECPIGRCAARARRLVCTRRGHHGHGHPRRAVGEDERDAQCAITAVMDEMHRIDHDEPAQAGVELSRINRDAAREAVPLSAEIPALIERALEFSRFVRRRLRHQLRQRRQPLRLPRRHRRLGEALARGPGGDRLAAPDPRSEDAACASAARACASTWAVSPRAMRSTTRWPSSASWAWPRDRQRRRRQPRARRPARPALERGDPRPAPRRRRGGRAAAGRHWRDLDLGDYERYFERDGVRCHHLIDAQRPLTDALRSVTILAPDGLTAEACPRRYSCSARSAGSS